MVTLNYGIVQRPKSGQEVSGDACLIEEQGSRILIGVADGLGSGFPAQEAAQRAISCLQEHPEAGVIPLMEICHEALRDTRGAALGLLIIEPETARVECLTVGNVDIRASQDSAVKPLPTNGIVGIRHHSLRPFTYSYIRGEWLVIFTDGVSGKFDLDWEMARAGKGPQNLADHLVRRFGRTTDDVTLMVAQLP